MANLYLISQDDNNNYDTYDSAVVCAKNEDEAKNIHPNGTFNSGDSYTWTSSDNVEVKYIGKADKSIKLGTVICASFNAG